MQYFETVAQCPYGEAIRQYLVMADKEFIPPLSSRGSSTQADLSGADPHRPRYHLCVIDLSALHKGGSFADLLDLAAVDELLSRRGLRTPFLRRRRRTLLKSASRTLAGKRATSICISSIRGCRNRAITFSRTAHRFLSTPATFPRGKAFLSCQTIPDTPGNGWRGISSASIRLGITSII